jgi:HEPN domain-containing protein
MNEVTEEWVIKAESDFDQANLAMYAVEVPIRDGVCYHCQQCAEKYFKAFLTENLVEFPRAHPLVPLLEKCLPFDPAFGDLRADAAALEGYAVSARYPGTKITDEMAEAALASAKKVRAFIRAKLNLT